MEKKKYLNQCSKCNNTYKKNIFGWDGLVAATIVKCNSRPSECGSLESIDSFRNCSMFVPCKQKLWVDENPTK